MVWIHGYIRVHDNTTTLAFVSLLVQTIKSNQSNQIKSIKSLHPPRPGGPFSPRRNYFRVTLYPFLQPKLRDVTASQPHSLTASQPHSQQPTANSQQNERATTIPGTYEYTTTQDNTTHTCLTLGTSTDLLPTLFPYPYSLVLLSLHPGALDRL
jgi:hypothetical protein